MVAVPLAQPETRSVAQIATQAASRSLLIIGCLATTHAKPNPEARGVSRKADREGPGCVGRPTREPMTLPSTRQRPWTAGKAAMSPTSRRSRASDGYWGESSAPALACRRSPAPLCQPYVRHPGLRGLACLLYTSDAADE